MLTLYLQIPKRWKYIIALVLLIATLTWICLVYLHPVFMTGELTPEEWSERFGKR